MYKVTIESKVAVTIPITSPLEFISGPPELPGWIGTSTCISLISSCKPDIALTRPKVALSSFPCTSTNGYPKVNTSSPTSVLFDLIIGIEFLTGVSTLIIAISFALS